MDDQAGHSMANEQHIEAWQRADSLNTYHLWLQMKREEGLRAGLFEPVNNDERAIAAKAKAVQQ